MDLCRQRRGRQEKALVPRRIRDFALNSRGMEQQHGSLDDGYLPVHWAASYDDVAALSQCISLDATQAARVTSRGFTPLHICALNNSVQCARSLLPLLPAAAINAVNCWGETPLHLACACSASGVRDMLLHAGADPSACDSWGQTAIQAAAAAHLGRMQRDAHAHAPPTPPPLPQDATSFNLELKTAILSRKLRSVPAPVVRGIFHDVLPPPPSSAPAQTSAKSSRRSLSSLVEYPGDFDAVCALLREENIDAAGADCFGLTGVCVRMRWLRIRNCSLLHSHPQIRVVEQLHPAAAAAHNPCASTRCRCCECALRRQSGQQFPPLVIFRVNPPQWSALHFCVDMQAHDALVYLLQGRCKHPRQQLAAFSPHAV